MAAPQPHGLPASPTLAHAALHGDPDLSLPASAAVDNIVVGREHRRKRKLATINESTRGVVVTDDDVGAAVIRESQAVIIAAGGNIAPAWFVPAMNAALTPAINAAIAPLIAAQANERIFRRNHASLTDVQNPTQFHRPNKVIAGFAAQPPSPLMIPAGGFPPAVLAVFQAPPPDPGVGVVPPTALHFPLNRNSNLTACQIGYLCRWYNDDMNILAGDTVQIMRNKLIVFLTGY